MPSETTTRPDERHPHIVTFERYSWGSNMDHTEFWVDCMACGVNLAHSDFGEPADEEELTIHQTKACVARRAEREAQLAAAIVLAETFALFKPDTDDLPF